MLKRYAVPAVLVTLALLLAPPRAHAQIEMESGDWIFGVSGNIQTFYVYNICDDDPAQVNGQPLLCAAEEGKHAVHNGLLPAQIAFTAATEQNGLDITATVALYAGTVSSNGAALGSPVLNARQIFLTFGNEEIGTFKFGRDYGLFAFDPIINDISLVGSGPTAAIANPLNTSLAGIGYGYIYADLLSQINYTTPSFGGFTATAGVYQPYNLSSLGANSLTGETGSTAPGFHGKLRYGFEGESATGFLSATAIGQTIETAPGGGGADYTALGFDVTGQVTLSAIRLTGYFYSGTGIGTTLLYTDAVDGAGEERTSSGGMAQAAITFDRTTLGVNYGISTLEQTDNDPDTNLNATQRITGSVNYALTPSLLLVGEGSYFTAQNHDDGDFVNYSFNAGVFLSF